MAIEHGGILAEFVVDIAVIEHAAATCTGDQLLDVVESTAVAQDLDALARDGVAGYPGGVAQRPEGQLRAEFVSFDDGVLGC